ncbi:hypothetical protein HK104_004448 [Borealophlyctis nickersoniae]|nr:hypothetical protein HK104_004448 [Borealophlyctis nickersoniae]
MEVLAPLEKQILDHLRYYTHSQSHALSQEEEKCMSDYTYSGISTALFNITIWGTVTFHLIDFRSFWPDKSSSSTPYPPLPSLAEAKAATHTPPPSSPSSSAPTTQPHRGSLLTIPRSPQPTQPAPPTPKPVAFRGALNSHSPRWLMVWGLGSILSGAAASTFLMYKRSARQCIQCLVDVEDKKSGLYQATRKLLKEYHPDAPVYFRHEKFKENLEQREGVQGASTSTSNA